MRVVLLLLIVLCNSLKFVVYVQQTQGAKCFYQALNANEKYFFQAISRTHQNYRLDVMRSQNNNWEKVVLKQADGVVESISKYAPKQGTYMFCITSNQEHTLKAELTIMTGLQMANFEYLPNNNDQENLHREVDWLEGQKKKLLETIYRIQADRSSSEDLNSKMSLKYIIFAIVGLGSVIGVNWFLYNQTKKTLKDRKLI